MFEELLNSQDDFDVLTKAQKLFIEYISKDNPFKEIAKKDYNSLDILKELQTKGKVPKNLYHIYCNHDRSKDFKPLEHKSKVLSCTPFKNLKDLKEDWLYNSLDGDVTVKVTDYAWCVNVQEVYEDLLNLYLDDETRTLLESCERRVLAEQEYIIDFNPKNISLKL